MPDQFIPFATTARRAVGYPRVSTEDQEDYGTSLDTQQDEITKWVHEMNANLVYMKPEDWTGAELDRPILNEARMLVRVNAVDVFVIYAVDRLSRDLTHPIILWKEMQEHNVLL